MSLKSLVAINISWLLSERFLRILLSFPVGILFARYLGPEVFGKWNVALSIIAIINIIPNYASSGLIPKLLLENTSSQLQVLFSTGVFRLVLSILSLILSYLIALAFNVTDLILLMALSYIFQSFNNIEYFFHSIIKSKYAVIAKNIGFISSVVLKIFGIYSGWGLEFFAAVFSVEFFVSWIVLLLLSRKTEISGQLIFSSNILKHYLRSGFHLLLSGVMSILYMKVDQLMIGKIVGNYEVGIYSVALRISELFYMVPTAVCSSLLPVLMKKKESGEQQYWNAFKVLYSGLFWISVAFSLFILLFGEIIITSFYGVEYSGAGTILIIHVWAGVAVSLGVASSQYLIIENMTKYSFFRTLIGLIVNLILNFLLIKPFGGIGAAIATLISYIFATFSIVAFTATRSHTKLIFRSLNPKFIAKYHELF